MLARRVLLAFTPLYVLRSHGGDAPAESFDDPSLQIWFQIAAFGAVLICGDRRLPDATGGEYLRRETLRDLTGDPWNGRTLEWSTSSPPPAYNFAFTPRVHDTTPGRT